MAGIENRISSEGNSPLCERENNNHHPPPHRDQTRAPILAPSSSPPVDESVPIDYYYHHHLYHCRMTTGMTRSKEKSGVGGVLPPFQSTTITLHQLIVLVCGLVLLAEASAAAAARDEGERKVFHQFRRGPNDSRPERVGSLWDLEEMAECRLGYGAIAYNDYGCW